MFSEVIADCHYLVAVVRNGSRPLPGGLQASVRVHHDLYDSGVVVAGLQHLFNTQGTGQESRKVPRVKASKWGQWYLVELWRVNACCVMVEEQLEAEFWDGHGPHVGHFDQVLDGGAAVDVHGPGVCSSFQEHLHEDVVAVPGGFVESRLMILFLEVGIWTDGYSDGTAAAQP